MILRAQNGDERAFGEIAGLFRRSVYRLALAITGDPAEAEDASQEAFLRAFSAIGRFDASRPLRPWLLKIAANRALSRAGRRRPAPLEEAGDAAETGGGPPESLEKELELERMREAIAGMEPIDRTILELRYEEGMKIDEIARTLGIREGAAKVRLFRARERLASLLEE